MRRPSLRLPPRASGKAVAGRAACHHPRFKHRGFLVFSEVHTSVRPSKISKSKSTCLMVLHFQVYLRAAGPEGPEGSGLDCRGHSL